MYEYKVETYRVWYIVGKDSAEPVVAGLQRILRKKNFAHM